MKSGDLVKYQGKVRRIRTYDLNLKVAYFKDGTSVSSVLLIPYEPIPDEDGWIEWFGGDCPLNQGGQAYVRFKEGNNFDAKVQETAWEFYDSIDWGQQESPGRQVAYYKPLNFEVRSSLGEGYRKFAFALDLPYKMPPIFEQHWENIHHPLGSIHRTLRFVYRRKIEDQELEMKSTNSVGVGYVGLPKGLQIIEGDEFLTHKSWQKTECVGYLVPANQSYRRKTEKFVGEGYRKLQLGEVMQKGDEYFSTRLRWVNHTDCPVKLANPNVVYRRKLPADPEIGEGYQKTRLGERVQYTYCSNESETMDKQDKIIELLEELTKQGATGQKPKQSLISKVLWYFPKLAMRKFGTVAVLATAGYLYSSGISLEPNKVINYFPEKSKLVTSEWGFRKEYTIMDSKFFDEDLKETSGPFLNSVYTKIKEGVTF